MGLAFWFIWSLSFWANYSKLGGYDWVAVKECKLSYHIHKVKIDKECIHTYIYIYIY